MAIFTPFRGSSKATKTIQSSNATSSLTRPPITPRVSFNAIRQNPSATVKIYVVSFGKVRDIDDAFPEWILFKFSSQAIYDLSMPRRGRKVFRIEGPVADNAVRTILGWMKANAKKDKVTPLNPQSLDIYQLLTVYHVADMFNLKPAPTELRDRIWDHVASTPLSFGMFTIIMGGLGHVENLVRTVKRKTVEHWVDGRLDSQKEDYLRYTEAHPKLEAELEEEVMNRISFLKREFRRKELPFAPVHEYWRKESFEDATEKQDPDGSEITFPEGTKKAIDNSEQQLARRDSARAGHATLEEEDIEKIIKRGRGGYIVKPWDGSYRAKDVGSIEVTALKLRDHEGACSLGD